MSDITGPCWVWSDIDGSGERWRLAVIRETLDGYEIDYPHDDFTDNYYQDDFEDGDIVAIKKPQPNELAKGGSDG